MNYIDFIIIIFLVLFVLESLGKSFYQEFLDLIGFVISFILSLRYFYLPGKILETQFNIPVSFANVLGFIFIWFFIETIIFTIIHFILVKYTQVSKFDFKLKYFTSLIAVIKGFVFISLILILIGTFPIQPKVKKAVLDSKIGSFLLSKSQQLEGPLNKVFGGLSHDTISFLTIKPKSDETVDLGFTTIEYKPNNELELKMVELVNSERKKEGLKTLSFNEILRDVGREHSGDMFTKGYFSHYSKDGKTVADRVEEVGFKYLVVGENLAFAPDLNLAHAGLMNSLGHRANILSKDYNKIGIGIQDGGVYGLMVTQVFSD